jgi:hypothetical protein
MEPDLEVTYYTRVSEGEFLAARTGLMRSSGLFGSLILLLVFSLQFPERTVHARDAASVTVRHPEGLVHGFLSLSTLNGKRVADGDLIQNVNGDRVTSRLVFRFKDGSIHDETAVFSQQKRFQLLSHRLVQKGPSFPQPLEMSIDRTRGQVSVRYTEKDGDREVAAEQMDLPPNLANGMLPILMKNIDGSPVPELSIVAATPKPRLVTLEISAAGQETFTTGGMSRKATHFVVKVEIGGIAGLLAPLLGKQPPDTHVWILAGEAPAFIKSEGPMFLGGPIWRIELVGPTFKSPS